MGKKNKILKIRADVTCPICREKYSFYLSKKGKKKGILVGEYFYEGFIDSHYGYTYNCYSCGYHWEERKSKKSSLVKIFPFLENK